jgi:hypothetical protein
MPAALSGAYIAAMVFNFYITGLFTIQSSKAGFTKGSSDAGVLCFSGTITLITDGRPGAPGTQ